MRKRPPKGTEGLERCCVSGCRREPSPPASTTARMLGAIVISSLLVNKPTDCAEATRSRGPGAARIAFAPRTPLFPGPARHQTKGTWTSVTQPGSSRCARGRPASLPSLRVSARPRDWRRVRHLGERTPLANDWAKVLPETAVSRENGTSVTVAAGLPAFPRDVVMAISVYSEYTVTVDLQVQARNHRLPGKREMFSVLRP